MLVRLMPLLCGLFAACCAVSPTAARAADPGGWERQRYLQRVASALRNGAGLGPDDDLPALMALSDEAVIEHFMRDPRFADTLLSFSLDYLGRGIDVLRIPVSGVGGEALFRYAPAALAVPQAVATAVGVFNGTGFALFDDEPALLVPPRTAPVSAADDIAAGIRQRFGDVVDLLAAGDKAGACALLRDRTRPYAAGGVLGFAALGLDPRLDAAVKERWLEYISSAAADAPENACSRADVSAADLAGKVDAIDGAVARLLAAAGSGTPESGVHNLTEFSPLDLEAPGLPYLFPAFSGESFFRYMTNSSGNHSRKRAAFLLRTYFCDDLTPIDVGSGSGHGQHASDPGCQACHYKLDPMGGLFRDLGRRGKDYGDSARLIFDDGGSVEGEARQSYLDTWRRDDGNWLVGFAVEPGVLDADWTGDRPADFLRFVSASKAAKSCFTKRTAQYFAGKRQLFDGGWLAELSERHLASGYQAEGVRGIIKDLLLSKAFRADDPNPQECYDHASGAEQDASRPPCAIDHIIATSCESCHNRSFAYKGLDLTTWVTLQDGSSTFKHLKGGVQQDRNTTFERIKTRITSGSGGPKMPLGREMTPVDRQALYTWLDQQRTP